jgi:hypothetical protein
MVALVLAALTGKSVAEFVTPPAVIPGSKISRTA